ncbi:MAG: GspE/PulE family protein, partial [Candidatus Paceibacterota bacterium]
DFSTTGYPNILSRIKLLSGLKINVHNVPQDGRFTIRQEGRDIEVRVSVLPGAYGENIVMRLLDPLTIRQKLEDLGMRGDTLAKIKKLLQKTTGSILTTGPTGSGKTTTLYAFLRQVNSPDVKIITIEDPIEYHIEGVAQTQVDARAGYTFADGLRSIVRQDPDVILVGEIRDAETAEIAMQASLTGHLVFSTLHTNNAAGTIPRLIDFNVKPVTIAPALNAAMAQRLVRRLCENCKKKQKIAAPDLELLRKYLAKLPKEVEATDLSESMEIHYPQGCEDCNGTGYKGRIGVYELFEIDPDMERLILKSPAISEVEDMAKEKGMITLLQDGLIKAISGITSIDEVLRVV